MVNIKKISKILCLSILFAGASSGLLHTESMASNSILQIETENSSGGTYSSTDSSTIQPSVDVKPEDFVDEFEMPSTTPSNDWQEELLKPEDFLPEKNVTMKDFENKVLERMLEVVSLLQTFAKPFCILLFILCGLGVLMSIVFGTKKEKMFLLGLILSVITYVGVVFAPNLVLFFANWLSF